MAKRVASFRTRMEKLKNPNFSVSLTRLCIRNLPRHVDDKELRVQLPNTCVVVLVYSFVRIAPVMCSVCRCVSCCG